MRDALSKLVGKYDKQLKSGTCPIIEILQRDSEFQPAANRSSDHRKRKSTRHLRPFSENRPSPVCSSEAKDGWGVRRGTHQGKTVHKQFIVNKTVVQTTGRRPGHAQGTRPPGLGESRPRHIPDRKRR